MRAPFPIVLLAFAACAESDPRKASDAGFAALGAGEARTACALFDEALEHAVDGETESTRARMGRCEALARFHGERARRAFLELAGGRPEAIRPTDYSRLCAILVESDHRNDAIEVLHAGKVRYPQSVELDAALLELLAAVRRSPESELAKRFACCGPY